jgi:sulfate transport system permease protein
MSPKDIGRVASKRRLPSPLLGVSMVWLSVMVLLPLAALIASSTDAGLSGFWNAVSNREAVAAFKFTLLMSIGVAAINAAAGTLIAWVLVRDEFRGKSFVNALIDLPFALPTIVAGLTLLALYGPKGPAPVDIAFSRWAVLLALLFVTLPFVVRSVQPVLMELDAEAEEASASLGARPLTTFRRVILPSLLPAILSGAGLALGRALGEFGSVVLISGNLPFKTEVSSVFIYNRIQSGDDAGAAAVSVALLAASLILLSVLAFAGRRWAR